MKIFDNAPERIGSLQLGIANTEEEIKEAQELRYRDLVLAFNNTKSTEGTDASIYDTFCDILIVKDLDNNKIVGTYRLMSSEHLKYKNEFICEYEFDISKLKNCGYKILELGRAVVHPDYRNGSVLKLLWQGIFAYVKLNNIRYLFGTASFHGVDVSLYKNAFTNLYLNYMASDDVMAYALPPRADLKQLDEDNFDLNLAKSEMPSLIKGYLMLGCKVGEGLSIDYDFNDISTLIIFDIENMNKPYVKRMFGAEI